MAHPCLDNTSAKVLNFMLNSMPPTLFVSRLRMALDPAMGHTHDEFSVFIDALKGLGPERAVARAQKSVQLSSGNEEKGIDTGHAATTGRRLECHRDTCEANAYLESYTLSLITCFLLLCFLACRNPSLSPPGTTATAFELSDDSSFNWSEEGSHIPQEYSTSSNALGLYEDSHSVDDHSNTPFHTPRTSFESDFLPPSPLPVVIDQLPPTSSDPSSGNTELFDHASDVGRTPSSTAGLLEGPQASPSSSTSSMPGGDSNSAPVLSTRSTVILMNTNNSPPTINAVPLKKAEAPAQPMLACVPSTLLSKIPVLSAPNTIATSPTGTTCNDLRSQLPPTATTAPKASMPSSTPCSSPRQVTLKKFARAAQSQDPSRLPIGTCAQGRSFQSSLPLFGPRLPMPIFPNPIFKLPPYIELSLTNTPDMGTGGATSHKNSGPVSPRLPIVAGAPVETRQKD